MTANALDNSGAPVTASISWSSSDSTIAKVSPTGEIAAITPGRAVITAKAGGAYAAAPVTIVEKATAGSLTISPQTADIAVGDSVQFSATRDSAAGQTNAAVGPAWTTSNAQVAKVSPTGLVTGVSAGIVSIRVTSGEQTAVATVTVVLASPSPPAAVASVTLDPSAIAMTVGDQRQIAATTRDASGAILTGRSITWTSSDPSVVSVSSTGMLTAVANGSATVMAESEGQSGMAAVTVVAPTSSTPADGSGASGLWTHQPSGLSTITEQSWNSIPSLGWNLDWDQQYSLKVSVVPDATAPLGDPKVLQFYYPEGFTGGSGPGTVLYHLSASELYLGFYWKMSPNWQGHTSSYNKLFYVFQRNGDDRQAIFLTTNGPVDGPWHFEISNEPDGGSFFQPNVSKTHLDPDRWYFVELHLKRSSADGAPDGVVEWWVDGQLNARYTNAKLRDEPFSEIHIDPVWGGAEHVQKLHSDYFRFGRFHVSGR